MKWTETVGVRLAQRDLHSIQLQLGIGQTRQFQVGFVTVPNSVIVDWFSS